MDLAAYVKLKGTGEMTRLHRESGVSYATIHRLSKKGHRLSHYDSAKRLSEATGGVVSIAELCEAPKLRKRRRVVRDSDAPGAL